MIKAADVGPTVGARMRELRIEAGLSQGEVARRIGSHRPIIARIERGVHDQSVWTIVLYARAIGRQPTAITCVLDDPRASTVDDGAACMVPAESAGRSSLGGHETRAASSSVVNEVAGTLEARRSP